MGELNQQEPKKTYLKDIGKYMLLQKKEKNISTKKQEKLFKKEQKIKLKRLKKGLRI